MASSRSRATRIRAEQISRVRIAEMIEGQQFRREAYLMPHKSLSEIPGTRAWFRENGDLSSSILYQGKERG